MITNIAALLSGLRSLLFGAGLAAGADESVEQGFGVEHRDISMSGFRASSREIEP